jgi:hypothetical protein
MFVPFLALSAISAAAQDSTPKSQYLRLPASERREVVKKLITLVKGLLLYEDRYGHFPPAVIRSETGEPLYSWRVAILPFIDEERIHDEFRLSEPWNSEHNKKFISKMPDVYAGLGPKESTQDGRTQFLAPVANGCVYEPGKDSKPTTFDQITDGVSVTVVIVHLPLQKPVTWTSPEDWNVDFENVKPSLFDDTRGETLAAFCDGSCKPLTSDLSDTDLEALLTKSANDRAEGFKFNRVIVVPAPE